MTLEPLPRLPLAHLPTPLEPLPRLRAALQAEDRTRPVPLLLVKRDDQTGLASGGNKTRKLEYLLAEALAEEADTVLTVGAPQSNHCRQTAAAAAKAGLRCVLVLGGSAPRLEGGNLLLDRLLGAEIVWAGQRDRMALLAETASAQAEAGYRPYVITYGGSSPVGAAGYAVAFQELLEQTRASAWKVDHVAVASSSGGTQAGMAVGAWAAGFGGQIHGISIDRRAAEFQPALAELATQTASLLSVPHSFEAQDFIVHDAYLGGGYGVLGDPERGAIRLLAASEGLLADPVYTGRALAGLLDLLRQGRFGAEETVIFWHTGGLPALFAYAEQLA
ncbi:MAG TPA: D-cysteine desulfhydrase family protein [Anaerolineae bacterium]|nr:D-cysteine desulfhydrase family protein [Anaerolineae bacterium]